MDNQLLLIIQQHLTYNNHHVTRFPTYLYVDCEDHYIEDPGGATLDLVKPGITKRYEITNINKADPELLTRITKWLNTPTNSPYEP